MILDIQYDMFHPDVGHPNAVNEFLRGNQVPTHLRFLQAIPFYHPLEPFYHSNFSAVYSQDE